MWKITNTNIELADNQTVLYSGFGFKFIANEDQISSTVNGYTFYLSGYIVPRIDEPNIFNKLSNLGLIEKMYEFYKDEFINHIKGNFIIQIIDTDHNIQIYTDHIGIKKIFYWQKDDQFIVSDNINEIVKVGNPKVSSTNVALHSLFHHFIDGRTMYEDIFYSKPASHFIIFSNGVLNVEQYWDYGSLLQLPKKEFSYNDFAKKFISLADSYISLSKGENITMTLTGGMDSRIILGSLLANDIKPYAFTFGNENSADVECSTKIARAIKLVYNNYNYPNPDSDWYMRLSQEIVTIGNSLVHIHRAHRLDALKREKKKHPNVDTIFLGAMGGEGIRGLHYDDLITTAFVRRIYENNENIHDLIKEILQDYFLDIEKINIDELVEIIKDLPFIKNEYKENQFFLLYQLVASLHDTQDISLYYTEYKNVITPFLDIDYLEMLFSSNYHLLKKEGTSHKIKDRLIIPEFHCYVSHYIYPKLDKFQFSNGFSPKEYLFGKYPYLLIRGIRKIFRKKYPSNFPYNQWFIEFVINNTYNIELELEKYFDFNRLKSSLNYDHHSVEGYWHKFSNLIMYNMIIKQNKS